LKPSQVIGLDPNAASLEAARVRALGHETPAERIRFEYIEPTCRLPQDSNAFDLTVSVSAIEYIHDPALRRLFVNELVRVTRPGGFVYLSTPSPLRVREFHTGRIFGNQIRRDGYPWANPSWDLRRMFTGCDFVPVGRYYAQRASKRLGVPLPAALVGPALTVIAPWQKILARKR
jgi:SAM-dependent methyltransferase